MPEGYSEAGTIWTRPGVGMPTQLCISCSTIVFNTEIHDDFHAALADLFEKLDKLA